MNKSYGRELWELSMAMQSLEQRDEKEIMVLYGTAMVLANRAEVPTEKMWAEKLVDDAHKEMKRRHPDFFAMYVRMDNDGNFVAGKEDLKRYLLTMDFYDMDEIIGRILQTCPNSKQYDAWVKLEQEIFRETSRGTN